MSKQYILPTNRLYAMTTNSTESTGSTELADGGSSSSDDDDSVLSFSSSSDGEEEVNTPAPSTDGLRRSSRQRRQPSWLASGEWVTWDGRWSPHPIRIATLPLVLLSCCWLHWIVLTVGGVLNCFYFNLACEFEFIWLDFTAIPCWTFLGHSD